MFLNLYYHSEYYFYYYYYYYYYYYRSKATSDVQSIKTEYSQELSQAQMQAMEAMEAMRVRTDAQIDSLRSQLDNSQKMLQEKISYYEQVVSGT